MRRGHANLICIVPILTDDPRRESIRTVAICIPYHNREAAGKGEGGRRTGCDAGLGISRGNQRQTQATLRNTRKSKAGSTLRSSRAVPHPSTNRALRRLTSEVGRDPVHSTRYGRQQRQLFLSQRPMFMMNNRGATFGLSTRKSYAPLVYHGVSF